jgi:hypothetical protein
MYTVDRIFPAEPEEPSGGGGEEEPVLSPGVAGRRLVAAPSPRLRLVAKSGALNVISEHLTWWNPLSFNNAIRHLLLALDAVFRIRKFLGLPECGSLHQQKTFVSTVV